MIHYTVSLPDVLDIAPFALKKKLYWDCKRKLTATTQRPYDHNSYKGTFVGALGELGVSDWLQFEHQFTVEDVWFHGKDSDDGDLIVQDAYRGFLEVKAVTNRGWDARYSYMRQQDPGGRQGCGRMLPTWQATKYAQFDARVVWATVADIDWYALDRDIQEVCPSEADLGSLLRECNNKPWLAVKTFRRDNPGVRHQVEDIVASYFQSDSSRTVTIRGYNDIEDFSNFDIARNIKVRNYAPNRWIENPSDMRDISNLPHQLSL